MRPYIDCHNHIGRTLNRLPPTGQSTAMCLARFAETDVYACLSMPTATGGMILRGLEDIRDQNRVIARARRDFPEHVPLGLALVEPCLGQVAVDEAEWAMSELGLHGIVSHPPVREACIPFLEMAAGARRAVQYSHARRAFREDRAHVPVCHLHHPRQQPRRRLLRRHGQRLVRDRAVSGRAGQPLGLRQAGRPGGTGAALSSAPISPTTTTACCSRSSSRRRSTTTSRTASPTATSWS